ncbi:MAG TPA: zinc ABC transporter substrate-binding protein, partial [Smithella sp.]|nr:zinc ABC transporter substrate-binding protein [Smithella sp.]HQN71428.1 zinc ABC transporter substrate-binding protein [Smithella sp.]
VIATIFPVYDFARHIGGDKITLAMLLPPGTDAHHYELKPDDIIKVTNADVFLFTNFELEQWAYKIIGASDKNTRLQAVETGNGAMMLRLNKEEDEHEAHPAGFDPHIWLDMDNAQKMVDNITSAFIKKDPRNSDYYLKNAGDYKRQLADMDQKYRTTLAACKTRTVLHAGHWAFAYLTSRYHLKYIAAYNVFADAEPAPQKIFALIDQIKNENVSHVYYEDMMNPRLAKTIARETGTGLLKLNNGHDVTRTDLEKGETFLALMEKNLVNFQKGLQCPEK